ncbi:MarR family winged helix-turn-helix transcriptional regulator [Desulfobotulus mexicanus]|uniref:Winged helix-turn-helix transcriptional regulator n=1 Tax=Desulfobotulus mexicanus TaxID=2586642 RepID=A0A5Q4VF13_9BACT|nr:MarR family winged helix-turn-helix transcriptional regulator [Desulfobotulus mexicanus]TYT74977.1 winged helix-turn-helix transcriptional regulator [Desulfobotulus mexicanus]
MDDKRLFYLIHRVHGKLIHGLDQFLWDRLQVTSAQLMALFYIRDHDGCLLKDLGEGIQLKSSGITGLVRRMEKNGLISRKTCPHDGRGFRIYISPEGERIASGAMPMVAALNGMIHEGFSVEEMETVFRFLNTLLERVSGDLFSGLGQGGQDNGGSGPAA